MDATRKEILKLGWAIDEGWKGHYRASQGGFKTMWRPTPEAVLADVRKIAEARGKCVAPF